MIIDKISNTINYRKLFVAGTAVLAVSAAMAGTYALYLQMKIKYQVLAVSAAMAGTYKVVVPLSEDEEGAMAYLSNYDTGENIDSVLVADNKAVFTGKLDKAIAARMMLDGKRTGVFFVEPDAEVVLDVKTNEAKGGALNAANAGFAAKERELVAAFVPLPTRQPKRPYTKNTWPSATA